MPACDGAPGSHLLVIFARFVQWTRTLDYGSRDRGSNPLLGTKNLHSVGRVRLNASPRGRVELSTESNRLRGFESHTYAKVFERETQVRYVIKFRVGVMVT